jgi:hypothetical protein
VHHSVKNFDSIKMQGTYVEKKNNMCLNILKMCSCWLSYRFKILPKELQVGRNIISSKIGQIQRKFDD